VFSCSYLSLGHHPSQHSIRIHKVTAKMYLTEKNYGLVDYLIMEWAHVLMYREPIITDAGHYLSSFY
jgi:hypothetical protein